MAPNRPASECGPFGRWWNGEPAPAGIANPRRHHAHLGSTAWVMAAPRVSRARRSAGRSTTLPSVDAIVLQDRSLLAKRLRPHLAGAKRALVFGSVARGEADEWSDLDLVVIAETERTFFERFREFDELYEVWPRLDLLVYTPAEFGRMVEEENPFLLRVLEEGIEIL